MTIVYQIRQISTGKLYIGCTDQPTKRWKGHKQRARRGGHPLYDAMKDAGLDDFVFEYLANGGTQLEKELIAAKKTLVPDGFNLPHRYVGRRNEKHEKGILTVNGKTYEVSSISISLNKKLTAVVVKEGEPHD